MQKLSRRIIIGALTALAAVAPRTALLADESAPTSEPRVALKGYDPVSYFTPGHPEKGSAEFTAAFDGTTYWFTNAEHKALFVADPDHYAPRFNGYCTVQVSRGVKYEADPETWRIADGKLLVFGGPKAVIAFDNKKEDVIARASENWPEVSHKAVSQTPILK